MEETASGESAEVDAANMPLIVDLFAGPGGWDEGLRMLGLTNVIGIEHDMAACQTGTAAGHRRICADVSEYDPEVFVGRAAGLIASPPCQAFSSAGSGKGSEFVDALIAAVYCEDWTRRPDPDPKVWLVLEPGRWADVIRPDWIAMEQVPGVLPIWEEYARTFTRWGYRCHVGLLNSADFGVPQTRTRAVLTATRGRHGWPVPTHAEKPAPSLFGPEEQPWVSMADALGWPESWEVELQRGAGMTERHGDRPRRRADRPAPTIRAGTAGSGTNLTVHKVPS